MGRKIRRSQTRAVLVVLLVFFNIFSVSAVSIDVNEQASQENLDAPFSITVDPDNITVMTGEDIVFTISIEAEEGFASVVELELELNFVGYNMTINMFPLNPSFPRMQEATIEVPSRARAGVAKGVLKAISGEHIVIKTVQILLIGEKDTSVVYESMSNGILFNYFTIFSLVFLPQSHTIMQVLSLLFRENMEAQLESKNYYMRRLKLWEEIGRAVNEYMDNLVSASIALESRKFVGDSKSRVYHDLNCTYVMQINLFDIRNFSSKTDAESAGFTACSICIP